MDEATKLGKYLRRVIEPKYLVDKVSPKVFRAREKDFGHGISLTETTGILESEESIHDYLEHESQVLANKVLGCVFIDDESLFPLNPGHIFKVIIDPVEGDFGDAHRLLQEPSEANLCPGDNSQIYLAYCAQYFRKFPVKKL